MIMRSEANWSEVQNGQSANKCAVPCKISNINTDVEHQPNQVRVSSIQRQANQPEQQVAYHPCNPVICSNNAEDKTQHNASTYGCILCFVRCDNKGSATRNNVLVV